MTAAAGQLLGFTIPAAGARGRLVRLGDVADSILGAHSYPEAVARLLAEALALTALLGSVLAAEGGQLTLQVRGEQAPIGLLVTDWRQGELRGYATFDPDRRLKETAAAGLAALFGAGRLVLTVDGAADAALPAQRYQGIIDLDAPTLEEAARRYFTASEQVPTMVRLAASRDSGGRWRAGGLLLQRLPDGIGADGMDAAAADFDEVAIPGASVRDDELLDTDVTAELLLWRLFHQQQVHLFPAGKLQRGCRCTIAHIEDVLGRFSEQERSRMRNADGRIAVDCEFCSRQFLVDL